MARLCDHCEKNPVDYPRQRFCGSDCRKRAWRRRAAGLPENALNSPAGGRRGRTALDGSSRPGKAERAAAVDDELLELAERLQELRDEGADVRALILQVASELAAGSRPAGGLSSEP